MSFISIYEAELQNFSDKQQQLAKTRKLRKKARWTWGDRPTSSPDLDKALNSLEGFLDQSVLEILSVRDAIHTELPASKPTPQDLLQLAQADQKCRELSRLPEWLDRVERLRSSFKPDMNEQFWWWFPQPAPPPTGRQKQLSWVMKWGANVIWVVALAFLIDISSRVVSGMPDIFGTGAVLINTLLGVLVGKGILTGTNTWLGQQIESLGLCKKHERWVQIVVAIAVCCIAFTIHQDLPIISAMYFNKAEATYFYHQNVNAEEQVQDTDSRSARESSFFTQIQLPNRGMNALFNPIYLRFIRDRSENPQADYYRATKLNPANWKAHNRLGEVYEDQEDLTQAIASYQTAAKGRLPASLINLSRSYILKENSGQSSRPYLTAIGLLTRADGLIDQEKKRLKKQNPTENPQWKPEIILDEYNRRFHEAWAYLKLFQISPKEAQRSDQLNRSMDLLKAAICKFEGTPVEDVVGHCEEMEEKISRNIDPTIISKKFAHCVRAEVMDAYRDKNLSPDEIFGIQNSEDDWDLCAKTIARAQGSLRSYEAGWWTRATGTGI